MIHQIVDLEVPMHNRVSITGPRLRVPEEGDHVVEMRDRADGLARLDVDGLGLRGRDGGEGFELAVVEAGGLAEGGDVDGGGDDAVELGEGVDCCAPPVTVIALVFGFI